MKTSGRLTINPLWDHGLKPRTDYSFDFQTPPLICKYMASLIPPGTISVLEPSPGIGNLVRELDQYQVTAPEDFFLLDRDLRFDCVVMNPPFSPKFAKMDNAPAKVVGAGMRLGYYFLQECMKMSDHVIALMPWFTISDSDVRQRQLKDYGLRSITGLPRRTFPKARVQCCIFELDRGYQGLTEFKVYDRIKPSTQQKFL